MYALPGGSATKGATPSVIPIARVDLTLAPAGEIHDTTFIKFKFGEGDTGCYGIWGSDGSG